MDSKKPETSEKTRDLSEEDKYSEDISDEKHKQSPQKATGTRESDTSSKSSRPSAHTSTTSSKDPVHKIELDATPSSTDIFISSRSLRSRTKCSRNLDAIISPRKNLTVPFSPEFLHSDASGSNVSRKKRSSLGDERDTHVLSPPGRVAGRVTRSLSKVWAETNTPSPDKRSGEVQTPTPTKKIRKGPERRSGRFHESSKSKLSPSTDAKVVRKSPTDAQTQEKRSSKMVEKSEPLTTTALVIKRKRKSTISSSEESETVNDLYKLRSPFSGIDTPHKSPSNVQTQESKPDVEDVGEPCIKITKAQEQSLISSKDKQLISKELDSTPETLTLGPPQSSPQVLNPHVFSSPSKISDSGIETKTFESCQISPKILNPQSLPSCHTPKMSDSIIYTPRQTLKYETSEGKSEIDANPSIACTLKSPKSKTTTSGGMLRGSGSDETLTSRHGQYGESNSAIESASLDRSRSLSEIAKEPNLPFQSILPRCAPTDTSPGFRTQSNQVIVEVTENVCNELSTATSDQVVQMQGGNELSFLQKLQKLVRSISDDVFISGNRQTRINAPNPDVSTSDDESCNDVFPQRRVRSISDNVFISGNRQTKINAPKPDVSEVEVCTSKDEGCNDPFSQKRVRSISDNVSISGNQQTGMSDIHAPNPDVSEVEVCSSKDEGRNDVLPQRHVRSISDNVFISGNRQARINAPNPDVSEVEVCTSKDEGCHDVLLPSRVRSISDNVSISGNQQTEMSDIHAPNPDVSEVEVCTSKDKGCNEVFPQKHVRSISDNVFRLANPPAKSNISPPHIVKLPTLNLDLYEVVSSSSSCQPATTDDYGTSSDDQLDSSSDVPRTKEARVRSRGAIEQFAPSGDECFPAHDTEARQHLHSVMKAMLLQIKEDDQVKEIESLFAHLSPSSSKEDVRDLYIYLITYLGSRKKDLWVKSMSQDTTPEAYLGETYEKLLTMVIETFASTLSVRSCSDFDEIILHYQNFKTFHDIFSGYWENNNIDDVEDEGCRENLKNLKEKIERYILVVQTAFQHFLAYVGEKADQKSLAIYEDKLSELDKKFLRRE